MSLTPEAEAERESVIAAAITARKIRDEDAPGMRQLYASQPAIAVNLLTASVREGGLAPGIAPAIDRVTNAAPADAYPREWMSPSERAVAAGQDSPASNRVQVEQ